MLDVPLPHAGLRERVRSSERGGPAFERPLDGHARLRLLERVHSSTATWLVSE